jgi:acyl-CoA thioester hydrolase
MSGDKFPQRRGDYPYRMTIPTRWNDNDMLGHVNNVVYYSYFEAVVVRFVMEETGTDWGSAPFIPYAVESLCRFVRPVKFPQTLEAGMRVEKIGSSSVTYDMALFAEGDERPAAIGHWVHVWVDRKNERPVPIPDAVRAAYGKFT